MSQLIHLARFTIANPRHVHRVHLSAALYLQTPVMLADNIS